MKFSVIHQQTSHNAHSPMRVVEQTTDRGIAWINRYLDREYVRRIADTTLRTYAHNLLHFVRWWESVHHTSDIVESDLTESTLLEYVRFQSSQQPRPSASTINDRVAVAERAIRNEFPDAPCQIARGFHQAFLRRRPMGLGRPRVAMSRLRVKVPKRNIVLLAVDEVARFWSSFRTSRDLAIVGLMLLQGLRSAEVLALNRDDALLSEESLFRRALRLTQRTRARNAHDRCGIAFLIPLPSPDHQHQPRQPPSLSTHLCLRHDPRRHESSYAHAADGSRGHPDHAALCVGHPTRRLP